MGLDELAHRFHHLAGPRDDATDRELLAAFASGTQPAFGRLVDRHGAMVLGVCKRVTGDHHAAEDAFQATFLVLAKKADAGGWQESVANWLHGVAYRTAMRARAKVARARTPSPADGPAPSRPPVDEAAWREFRGIVDAEVARLPEKFRLPVVLCCLHDRTVEEAAEVLRLPPTTVKGRLQHGRELLRNRLARRGVGVGTGVLGMLSAGGTATAVPVALRASTTHLAAAGSGTGLVAALTREELRMMVFQKVKLAGLVGLGVAVAGVTAVSLSSTAAPLPSKPDKDVPAAVAVSRPKASEAVVEKELEVTVRPTRAVYGPEETPELVVTFTHAPKNWREGPHADPIRLNLLGADWKWSIRTADGKGPWHPNREFAAVAARKVQTYQLFACAFNRIETVQQDVLNGPFHYGGEQLASPRPLPRLAPGKYTVVGTATFGPISGLDQTPKPWAGTITTKPVELVIAEKLPADRLDPIVLDASSKGKKVGLKVGQRLVFELAAKDVGAGWSNHFPPPAQIGVPPVAEPLTLASKSFRPLNEATDLRQGTYVFEYEATVPGEVALDFTYAKPSAPWPVVAHAVARLAQLAVNVTVTK